MGVKHEEDECRVGCMSDDYLSLVVIVFSSFILFFSQLGSKFDSVALVLRVR